MKCDILKFERHYGRGIFHKLYHPMFSAIILFRLSCFLFNYNFLKPLAYLIVRFNDLFHGIWIGPRVQAGPGLLFAHSRGLIVNPDTKIGSNCILMQGVTLGGPKIEIGDNVLIGAHAQVISRPHKGEGLKIGDNVNIAAGAVIIHDLPDNVTAYGNPAHIINKSQS